VRKVPIPVSVETDGNGRLTESEIGSEDASKRCSGHERPGEGERADDPEGRHDERLDVAGQIERSERHREAEEYGTLQHERGVGAPGHRAAHRSGSVQVPRSDGQYPNRPATTSTASTIACSQPNWFRPSRQKERAGGLLEWSYDLPKTLRAGRYVALATGGAEPIHAARNSNSFRLVDFPG
jgi:hypothetical protein